MANAVVCLLLMVSLHWRLTYCRNKRHTATLCTMGPNAANQGVALPKKRNPITCPYCYQVMVDPCECSPCGHTQCTSCFLEHWQSTSPNDKAVCLIDDVPISMVVPDLQLYRSCAVYYHTNPQLKPKRTGTYDMLESYNMAFSSQPRPFWLWENLTFAQRLYFDFFYVTYSMRISYIVATALSLIYVLYPHDLIPEAASGKWYPVCLIDDLIIFGCVFSIIGSMYRLYILNKGVLR